MQERQKKEKLKKMFLQAIEDKKQQDLKVERENKFGTKVLRTYNVLKSQMEKKTKEKMKQAREAKISASEKLGKLSIVFWSKGVRAVLHFYAI